MEVATPPPDILAFARAITGGEGSCVTQLAGQASLRRYYRVSGGNSPTTCVIMELPREDLACAEESYPFLNVQRFLRKHGFPVPEVYKAALSEGFIGLEDLGDQTLEAAVRSSEGSLDKVELLYGRALSLIDALQTLGATPDAACVAFARRFDFKLLRWELSHFTEWLLQEDRKVAMTGRDMALVDERFDQIAEHLAASPPVLVHRDFQSRNLMVTASGDLRVIDFQDALLGPCVYDLVALLRDSYIELPLRQVIDFVHQFVIIRDLDPGQTVRLFHMQTVQRKLKDAGRFVFIDRKRGNPDFLPSVPLSLRYARDALRELPDFADLLRVLQKYLPEMRA